MQNIRSFVLRQSHFSALQKSEMEKGLLAWGVNCQLSILNLSDLFKRDAPKILEIGFGMGLASAKIAMENPQNDYLCVEVHGPGVGRLLKLIDQYAITNIRIIHHDIVPVLQNMLADLSLDGVHIFFPDPWPKKRHHKRRLIQKGFVSLLISKLKKNGYLNCVTDWEEYALHIINVVSIFPALVQKKKSEAITNRPTTKFEARGLKLGHTIYDLLFIKY